MKQALELIHETDRRTIREQVEISEIPAPPFGEEERGTRLMRGFSEAGLEVVERDPEGNVLGLHPGRKDRAPVVLSAHLDTVFPEGTDTRVQRQKDRWVGPGITDDSRGLAALLATARAFSSARLTPRHPILFVATVGEEGPGNLRGVKHLFGPHGGAKECRSFISLDGAGLHGIVVRGVGSVRLRIRVRGPGGHSWIDWGGANPLHALAALVNEILTLPIPKTPRTTLTVARWRGGHSINAIPEDGWVELDLRSEDRAALTRLEDGVLRAVESTARQFESMDGEPSLSWELEEIGRRPSGGTDPDTPLVQAALEASRLSGVEAHLSSSSTDANVPMALGIPAITMGAGGEGGRAHTLKEWYRNVRGPEGVARALLTALAVAGP